MRGLSPRQRQERIVDTAQAWKQYPGLTPVFTESIEPPVAGQLVAAVQGQQDTLWALMEDHIETAYLDPLQVDPGNDDLRGDLLEVYLRINQVDTAIRTAGKFLLHEQGNKAVVLNGLGNAYLVKGNLELAAYNYKEAAALEPEDRNIQGNLALVNKMLGLAPARPDSAAGGDDRLKSGEQGLQVDELYWVE